MPFESGTLSINAITFDDARLDIKATCLWENSFVRTFCDIKIFNPLGNSCHENLPDPYKYKKAKYEKRVIDVEPITFNPLVLACTGSASSTATRALKQINAKIREKCKEPNADVISVIRTKISFAKINR